MYVDGMSLYTGYFVPSHLDPDGKEIQFEANGPENVPVMHLPSLEAYTGDATDWGVVIPEYARGCECQECDDYTGTFYRENPNCPKSKIVCSVVIKWKIGIKQSQVATDSYRGIYGHEQRHIQAINNAMRQYLAQLEPRTACKRRLWDNCEVDAAGLVESIDALFFLFLSQESAHNRQIGGPSSGSLDEPIGDIPAPGGN